MFILFIKCELVLGEFDWFWDEIWNYYDYVVFI